MSRDFTEARSAYLARHPGMPEWMLDALISECRTRPYTICAGLVYLPPTESDTDAEAPDAGREE